MGKAYFSKVPQLFGEGYPKGTEKDFAFSLGVLLINPREGE
jgi:hypothetical protein